MAKSNSGPPIETLAQKQARLKAEAAAIQEAVRAGKLIRLPAEATTADVSEEPGGEDDHAPLPDEDDDTD